MSGTQTVSDFVQKHFVSATNVSHFARARKRHEQQCFRYNVSSFASSFVETRVTVFIVCEAGTIALMNPALYNYE